MHNIEKIVEDFFNQNQFLSDSKTIILLLMLLIVAIISDFVTKGFLVHGFEHIAKKTKSDWDDKLINRGVFNKLSHIAPTLIFYWGIQLIFSDNVQIAEILTRIVKAYMVVIGTSTILRIIDASHDIYSSMDFSKKRPIKGYLQLFKIILLIFSIILFVAILMNANPIGIISSLGAMSAILILVFKDTILGLVASINISANKMFEIGDWIEVPKYGADGNVIDITLQNVIVQNWDMTISTIPIYSFMTDTFKNWRGMSQSGGRRIKRHVSIDSDSVHFLSDTEIEELSKIPLLYSYLQEKKEEIEEYNKSHTLIKRELTNIGTFRIYIYNYLLHNPNINKNMTLIVRQLQSSNRGIPIEVYAFSKVKAWDRYEAIQSDIFDHIFAIMPKFKLALFQDVSNKSIKDFLQKEALL